MSDKKAPPSRPTRRIRRMHSPVKHKLFIYLTEEEKETLREAADKKRLSMSGYIAVAALEAATAEEEVRDELRRKKKK